MKRNRKLTGFLSLFFGFTGVHYIYLGELWFFFAYLFMTVSGVFLPFALVYSWIEAYYFFRMSDYHFNNKWNRQTIDKTESKKGLQDYLKHLNR